VGLGGFDWRIEGRNHKGYHSSECWSPRRGAFSKLGMLLVEFSGLEIPHDYPRRPIAMLFTSATGAAGRIIKRVKRLPTIYGYASGLRRIGRAIEPAREYIPVRPSATASPRTATRAGSAQTVVPLSLGVRRPTSGASGRNRSWRPMAGRRATRIGSNERSSQFFAAASYPFDEVQAAIASD